jgi:hypothetical protein
MPCYHCGQTVTLGGKIGRQQTCENCQRDLHVCRNCKFYDPASSQRCNEPQADFVRDKEVANFCDFFQFVVAAAFKVNRLSDPTADARRAFNDLFKK